MYRILVVDDEPAILEWLSNLLMETFGDTLDIRTAGSGQRALNIIESTPIDIALFDVSMPGIDGLTLAKKTLELCSDTVIIFLTGYDQFDYARNALKLGAIDYVLKNEDDDELIRSVRQAIDRKDEQYKVKELKALVQKYQTKETAGNHIQEILEQANLSEVNNIVEKTVESARSADSGISANESIMMLCFECLSFANKIGLYRDFVSRIDLLAMLHASTIDLDYAEKTIKKAVNELCDLMSGNKGRSAVSIVEAAQSYIRNNLDQDLSLVSVAEKVYINPSYLSWLYKNGTGENLFDYVRNLRLQEAMRLMREDILPVNEVARRVGYNNPAYFTRFFKQKTGLTPQEFKELNR